LEIFESEFSYIFTQDEFYYIIYNIAMILLTLIASSITAAFLLFCLRNLVSTQGAAVRDKVTYRFRLPKATPPLLAVGLCIIQISLLSSELLNSILHSLFNIARDTSFDYLYFPETAFGIVLYFTAIVLMPAFIEEFIFRYIMLNALKKYGNVFAIITTSVLFGFLHARASAFFYATAIGFFSAYIAIKTKSIWFSIILHALVNATSLTFQYVAAQTFPDEIYNLIYFLFLGVISVVSLIYIIILIRKRKDLSLNDPENYAHIENRRKLLFFFNAASIIFFILVILKSADEYVFTNIANNIKL